MQRLRILFELHNRGTLTEVAQALSYSPSAVSQQLTVLSQEVGTALIEPVGRRVRLTPQGEILARHAGILLQQMEVAEAQVAESLHGVRGLLRVAAFQTAFLGLIPPLVTQLSETYPELELKVVHVQPDEALSALAGHGCDLVIGEEYPGLPHSPSTAIDTLDLVLDPLRLMVGPGWSELPADVPWSTIRDAPWVLEPEGNMAREWAQRLCREAGFEPRVQFESADLLIHIKMAETGHALAILPDLVWRAISPPVGLRELPGRPTRRVFTAVRGGAGRQPAVVVVRRALAEMVESRPK